MSELDTKSIGSTSSSSSTDVAVTFARFDAMDKSFDLFLYKNIFREKQKNNLVFSLFLHHLQIEGFSCQILRLSSFVC
ncbi:uncharacterized protein MONOS_6044 [Monocercomonoides exilis]|uniref:uncharacterized protein n=1 Tax=Monocercomonoides exilis TaxID=2049356 RepID=UPI00355A8B55|nr:hypothetical protein MONOS_6044 [Monocercomonoides exilis]|eukprot:MONOS_6044.1-p1 / transcript=MONOS_6044.1 / gene=MONOS_6044 / organism=Monocercomonoides_exilis_PA203 / gene_product=unspecified product / transcript_product=unspecified product / location=Mono_scaffold00185:51877-52164(-) / protein_length=78 / sequence_SO=supercontig / SO=protein_coding / is_pseudo=false